MKIKISVTIIILIMIGSTFVASANVKVIANQHPDDTWKTYSYCPPGTIEGSEVNGIAYVESTRYWDDDNNNQGNQNNQIVSSQQSSTSSSSQLLQQLVKTTSR